MDTFGARRRAKQLPAISLQWGPWAEVGMAARAGTSEGRKPYGWEAEKREVASYDSHVFVSIGIFFDTAFSDLFKVNSPVSWFDSSKVRKGRFFGKILHYW